MKKIKQGDMKESGGVRLLLHMCSLKEGDIQIEIQMTRRKKSWENLGEGSSRKRSSLNSDPKARTNITLLNR
jgi:hypothetical protein